MSLSDKDNFSNNPNNFCYEKLSRRDIRSLIFHLIYAIESFEYSVSLESIVDNFNRGMNLGIPDNSEALEIAKGIVAERQELDKVIEPLLDNWRLDRIGVCTKLVLRLSIWELKHTDTPSSIVINEAIELAKCFSEKDAYRFVNGILDEVCNIYRKDEVEQKGQEEAEEAAQEIIQEMSEIAEEDGKKEKIKKKKKQKK
ncbi:transcription antitermination factor NusB [Candidatus Dependentiae bacterium]